MNGSVEVRNVREEERACALAMQVPWVVVIDEDPRGHLQETLNWIRDGSNGKVPGSGYPSGYERDF